MAGDDPAGAETVLVRSPAQRPCEEPAAGPSLAQSLELWCWNTVGAPWAESFIKRLGGDKERERCHLVAQKGR